MDITRAFENFGERDITLVSDTDLLEYHVELAQKISSKHVLGVPSGYKGSLLRQGMVMLETSALLKDVSTARRNNSSLLQYYPEFTHIGPRTSHSFLQYILQLLR